MKGSVYLHHIDHHSRYQGRSDDNLISISAVLANPEYGDAVRIYIDELVIRGDSAEFFLDAAQTEELGTVLLSWSAKLTQIAGLTLVGS